MAAYSVEGFRFHGRNEEDPTQTLFDDTSSSTTSAPDSDQETSEPSSTDISSTSPTTTSLSPGESSILSLISGSATQTLSPAESSLLAGLGASSTASPALNATNIMNNYTSLLQGNQSVSVYLHSGCLLAVNDTTVTSITIQNSTSWIQNGCSLGFYCESSLFYDFDTASGTFLTLLGPWTDSKNWDNQTVSNDTVNQWLPQYCPPENVCGVARLSGQSCPLPMGAFEPMVCPPGSYCPPGGNQNITCPEGHYCPVGSFKPIKCFGGTTCKEGEVISTSFIPLAVLILIDLFLISVVVIMKIKQRIKAVNAAHAMRLQAPAEVPLTTDTEYHGSERGSIPMEARTIYSRMRTPAGFSQLSDEETMMAFAADHGDLEHRMTIRRRSPSGFERLATTHPKAPIEENTDLHLFVQSLSKCMGGGKFGLSFEFKNLKFQPPKAPKPILSEVSGCINEGSLWGVMGASGAGKSTFVNVLMGKTTHTGGITKVNGIPGDIKKYKKIIGYVPQDDIVLPELTVRENILHSARIRLPSNWTEKEIQHHVDILVSCLQLSHVQHSLVGSPGAPVISGGQRKRVSIGMELAAAPRAIFLDEPTSGLDATAAASIMSTLKALTRLGMSIIVVIHQPRQEIFESLDSLVLLGAGRMIYQGPQIGMQPHFESLGFKFPEHNNPADIMGDIIAGEGRIYKPHGDASIQPLIEYWHHKHMGVKESKELVSASASEVHALTTAIKTRGAHFHKQVYYCFCRSIVQQYRLKSAFFFELGVGAMAGFLIGLSQQEKKGALFHGIYLPPYELLSVSLDIVTVPMMALLVALSIGLTASAPGVKIFGEEKLIYWREAAAGHNRFAYYLGKVLSTTPRMILACLHFSVLFLLLATPQISWINAFIAHLLYFYCIYGLSSCISMVARREDGPLLAVMASLIVGVLSGASPRLAKARAWHLVWLWRASPGVWLAEIYFDQNVRPLAYLYDVEQARKSIGFLFDQFGKDLMLLFCIGTIYRVVAFLGLRFMFPSKQR